jgi:photosystem II stability/assembly factor-like uncharacterized protein
MINLNAFKRRALLKASMGAGVLLFPGLGKAAAQTGIGVLDTAAIPVPHPDGVLLEAIARVGSRLVAVGQHGVIIYSDDNGDHWVQANVPVDVTLTCIGFATPKLGWAAGHFGVILNTADGGETWQLQLNGIQANQLTLAAAQALTPDDTSPGAPFALRRAEIFVKGGPNRPFLSLQVLDSQKIIVFGAYRMTMMTQDGGKTWVDWSLHIGDRLSHDLYAATSVGTDIYVAGEAGGVFCSTDGGNNFPAVTSPSSVTLFGVVGAPDGSVIVFGVAGAGFKSSDIGKTWTSIDFGTQDNLTAGLVLSSGAVVVASESGGLFTSRLGPSANVDFWHSSSA